MSKKTFTLIILIVLVMLGGGYYWFFVRSVPVSINTNSGANENSGNGIFAPFGQTGGSNGNQAVNASSTGATSTSPTAIPVPALREISSTPVGGYVSSTTASTTVLRWIDRGTGHIFQSYSDNTAIDEISDITVPMIYESYWNTSATSFILQSLTENSDVVTTYYATLKAEASTSSSTTPYTLAGLPLSSATLAIAVSPVATKMGNQVFTLVKDTGGGAAGFVSNFDGTKKTQIFDTPMTQLNADWPSANTIALTTKGTSAGTGFLYFIDQKNGTFNKILGDMNGLSADVNSDASEILYSFTNTANTGITTMVVNTTTGQNQSLPFSTLAEKCVWSKLQKNDLYCAIPSSIPSANYPDAWYRGTVSFNDSLWEIDTVTGDVHELVDLTKTAGEPIDAENLELSPKEDFIYFMNKKDLSLWSFDLNSI